MIRSGLVSVTFRKLSPPGIVELVAEAKLEGIEWGGDIHVPHGDVKRAGEVRRMTEDAGLTVASYGSYYRVGVSEADGLPFERVLESAVALSAPTIRVWAGNRGSKDADSEYRSRVVRESRRIADLAKSAGISISFEYHGNTLTDTNASAVNLLKEIDRDNVMIYWQTPVGAVVEYCLEGLNAILHRLSNVHVFHCIKTEGGLDRRPLSEGAEPWARYLKAIGGTGRDHFAMIEFVRNDSPENFLKDAETLKLWLENL